MRSGPGLRLDRDVYRVVCKLEGESKKRLTASGVYESIQRSNSSLRRQKKRPLEDSIERVLQLRRDEVQGDEDSEGEIEAEMSRFPEPKDERFLLNRQMTKLWRADAAPSPQPAADDTTAAPAGDPADANPEAPLAVPASKKRKLNGDRAAGRGGAGSDTEPPASANRTPAPGLQAGKPLLPRKARNRPYELENPTPGERPPLGGLDGLFSRLCPDVSMLLKRPSLFASPDAIPPTHGILVSGPPGVGKRSLVRAVAARCGRPLLRIHSCFHDLDRIEKNLADALEEARGLAPCILLLERVHKYTARASSGSGHGDPTNRSVTEFWRLMEKIEGLSSGPPGTQTQILVMATTSDVAAVDPSVLELLPMKVEVPLPGAAGREDILRAMLAGVSVSPDFDHASHARSTHGYVGRDLHEVVKAATYRVARRWYEDHKAASVVHTHTWPDCDGDTDFEPLTLGPLTNQDLAAAVKSYVPRSRKEGFSPIPDTTWAQVGALAHVRKRLRFSIIDPLNNPARFAAFNIGKSAGVLLWGPPGCGKTLVAKAVANEAGASFIVINGPELLNKYVGESERAVRELFARARASAPCILFFDEMDSLVPKRENSSTEAGTRVVNALLAELDGVQERSGVYVIGTTNRPDMIDLAMLRPGRLDTKLFLDLPTDDERADILKVIFRTNVAAASDDDVAHLETVARDPRCASFSGADLRGLYLKAVENRFTREDEREGDDAPTEGSSREDDARMLSDEDWEFALRNTRPSVKNPATYRAIAAKID